MREITHRLEKLGVVPVALSLSVVTRTWMRVMRVHGENCKGWNRGDYGVEVCRLLTVNNH
jgi:hypothetical protein